MSARTRFHACAAGLCAVLLAGCLDFETVTAPPRDRESRAEIRIHASFDEAGDGSSRTDPSVVVSAQVFPGADALGPRSLTTDTLWVHDRPLVPRVGDPELGWSYFAAWRDEPGTEVRFGLPRISRLAEQPATPVWHPLRRVGPDTLRLPRGRDLVLRMTPALPAARPDSIASHWTLAVYAGLQSVQLASTGPVPDSVVVPGALLSPLLPADGPSRLHANLRAQRFHSERSPAGDLEISTGFASSLRWVVEIVDAPAAQPSSRKRSP